MLLYEISVGDNEEEIRRELECLRYIRYIKKEYYMRRPSWNLYLRIRELLLIINSLERKLKRTLE